jgi:hypothetical protein
MIWLSEYASIERRKYLKTGGLVGGLVYNYKRLYDGISGSHNTNGINLNTLEETAEAAKELDKHQTHETRISKHISKTSWQMKCF